MHVADEEDDHNEEDVGGDGKGDDDAVKRNGTTWIIHALHIISSDYDVVHFFF